MELTGNHLVAAGEIFADYQRGKAIPANRSETLGPLWPVVLDAHGRWRNDASERLVRLLQATLIGVKSEEPVVARWGELRFGLAAFPLSYEATAVAVPTSPPVGYKSVALKLQAALGCESAIVAARRCCGRLPLAPPRVATRDWMHWADDLGEIAAAWPPVHLRRSLLERATVPCSSQSCPELYFEPPLRSSDDGLQAQLEDVDYCAPHRPGSGARPVAPRMVWLVLRQRACELALEYLSHGSAPIEVRAYNQLHRSLGTPWSLFGVLEGVVPPLSTKVGTIRSEGPWREVMAAALEYAFAQLVTGRRAHLHDLLGSATARVRVERFSLLQRAAANDQVYRPDHGADLDEQLHFLDAVAREVRLSSAELAPEHVKWWLKRRRQLATAALPAWARTELEVMREGLDWDLVGYSRDPQMRALRERLWADADRTSDLTVNALRAHRLRADAVVHTKNREHRLALQAARQGVAALARPEFRELGPLWLDLAHQSQLALAGHYVTMAEKGLRTLAPAHDPVPLAQALRNATYWARSCRDLLLAIESVPLGIRRWSGDGRLAVTSWRLQTRAIEVRALIAAVTAVRCRLVRPTDLTALMETPGGEEVPPLEPVSFDELTHRYIDLVELRGAPVQAGQVLQLALHVRLLSPTGLLPVPPPVGSSGAVSPLAREWLLQRPEACSGSTAPVSISDLVDRIRKNGYNLGWVGRLPCSSRVRIALESMDTNEGLAGILAGWIAEHPLVRG
jgi:hypothetical protein